MSTLDSFEFPLRTVFSTSKCKIANSVARTNGDKLEKIEKKKEARTIISLHIHCGVKASKCQWNLLFLVINVNKLQTINNFFSILKSIVKLVSM